MENSIESLSDRMLSSSVKRTMRCFEYSSANARKMRLKAANRQARASETAR
jgi:hypothetical protein